MNAEFLGLPETIKITLESDGKGLFKVSFRDKRYEDVDYLLAFNDLGHSCVDKDWSEKLDAIRYKPGKKDFEVSTLSTALVPLPQVYAKETGNDAVHPKS